MKTPTPTLNIWSTFEDPIYISGWVGEVLSDGTKIPEVGAYVYVYIDGFLVNPPTFDEEGNYNNGLQVLTDSYGNWQTKKDNVSLLYIQHGNLITAKAKSRGKEISDLCTPYIARGMVTPINIGVVGDFDVYRPPNDGEFILTGKFSYWDPPSNILSCSNRVLIYSDGYNIGEVLKNNIIGINAEYPIIDTLNGKTLSLRINGNIVSIPLDDINIINKIILNETPDGVSRTFTFPIKNTQSSFIVFKNIRQRCVNDAFDDYKIDIDAVNFSATITFFGPPPESSDRVLIYEVNSTYTLYNQSVIGEKNGINTIFYFENEPQPGSIQVFHNGIHLKYGSDYSYVEDYVQSRYYLDFNIPPEATDFIIVDYQKQGSFSILSSPSVSSPYGANIFSLPLPTAISNIYVYKNGILQEEATEQYPIGVYTLSKTSTELLITFKDGELIYTEGLEDTITVTYEITPLYIETFVEWLNNQAALVVNCTKAYAYVDPNVIGATPQLRFESGFTLDLVNPALSSDDYFIYMLVFGTKFKLDPGKDLDDNFLYYINGKTGEWKYSNLDLITRKAIPFRTGEHLSARAIHVNTIK